MSDQDEKKQSQQETDHTSEQKAPETSPAGEKIESTISLLDLIRETKGSDEPGAQEEDTAEIPLPLVVMPPQEDDPTVTITPSPTAQAPKSSPLPLAQDLRTPTEQPLVRDQEATEVQPRVAFSRRQAVKPVEERPTEIHAPSRPAAAPWLPQAASQPAGPCLLQSLPRSRRRRWSPHHLPDATGAVVWGG